MKRGDRVILFQDGKLCRGMMGVVLSNIRGHHVKVSYRYFDDDVLKGAIATLRVDSCKYGHKRVHGYTKVGYCTAEKICNVEKWYRMVTAGRYISFKLDKNVPMCIEEEYGNYRQSIIDDVYKLIE